MDYDSDELELDWHDSASHHLFHLCMEGFQVDIKNWARDKGNADTGDFGKMINWRHNNMV